jgi:hypothetical protein
MGGCCHGDWGVKTFRGVFVPETHPFETRINENRDVGVFRVPSRTRYDTSTRKRIEMFMGPGEVEMDCVIRGFHGRAISRPTFVPTLIKSERSDFASGVQIGLATSICTPISRPTFASHFAFYFCPRRATDRD